jgi:hypothetical protein
MLFIRIELVQKYIHFCINTSMLEKLWLSARYVFGARAPWKNEHWALRFCRARASNFARAREPSTESLIISNESLKSFFSKKFILWNFSLNYFLLTSKLKPELYQFLGRHKHFSYNLICIALSQFFLIKAIRREAINFAQEYNPIKVWIIIHFLIAGH